MSKVLLVEDDHSISTVYKIKLDHSGHICMHAENGLLALKILDSFTPEIILLDLRMPVMDGETFLKIFRKNEKYNSIPVLILTNLNRSEAPQTLWHLGISDYIVKVHNTPTEVMQLIDKTLNKV